MVKYIILLVFFLSLMLNSQEYKYSRDPNIFIKQIEKTYPDKNKRVEELTKILFDIYHHVSTFTEDTFFIVTNDYYKILIVETNKLSYLPYYYYMRGSIMYHHFDNDSSLICYKKGFELVKNIIKMTFKFTRLLL